MTATAAGNNHTCALSSTGGIKCWGKNTFGQLGNSTNGTYDPNPAPADVNGLTGVTAVARRREPHTCALTSAGGVKCWGLNSFTENSATAPTSGRPTLTRLRGMLMA